jgi:hypothetical protein
MTIERIHNIAQGIAWTLPLWAIIALLAVLAVNL